MTTDLLPAEAFPPGEYIKDEIEARGWTQRDLARVLGRSEPKVSELINGKRAVTVQTARELAAAFGTSAEVWLRLEAQWRLRRDESPVDAIERRSKRMDKAKQAASRLAPAP